MKIAENFKNYFSPENENVEILACFPWHGKKEINGLKGNDKMERNRAIPKSVKNPLLGICFITDMNGYFKYIHPKFLKLFEGVDNQFYETSILDKDNSLGSPSIMKYLVSMIQKSSPESFLKNRFSKYLNKIHKLQWNLVYNGGLLYFSLAEEPLAAIPVDSAINEERSPEQILSGEIKKIYWKIEHAKMFHSKQIAEKEISID